MFLHSGGEGDHPNQIQHPENIPHPLQTAGIFNIPCDFSEPSYATCDCPLRIVSAIAGLYAEQNTLIFKVSTSFLARILKPTHHMVNLSNESDQA